MKGLHSLVGERRPLGLSESMPKVLPERQKPEDGRSRGARPEASPVGFCLTYIILL